MERKYYLRGLGLGIVVTAVIMSIASSSNKAMTNEEIIARARELGMVENTVLSDTKNEDTGQENTVNGRTDASQGTEPAGQSETQDVEVKAGGNEESETDADGESESEYDSIGQDDAWPEDTGGDQDDAAAPEADNSSLENDSESAISDTVTLITISSGDGSYTVARKLADAGLITSAENFDSFLCANGYDKKLRAGSYSIPAGASDEQIARIVSGAE